MKGPPQNHKNDPLFLKWEALTKKGICSTIST